MRFFFLVIISLFIGAFSAKATDIDGISIAAIDAQKVEIVFDGSAIESKNVNIFEIAGDNPRIVIDINDGKSPLLVNGAYKKTHNSHIRGIRAANQTPNDIRFVIDLKSGSKFLGKTINQSTISIEISGDFSITKPAMIAASTQSGPVATGNIPIPRIKPAPPQKPIIVIDAGHGGHDPGALGGSGLQEKSVTLKAAKELQSQLNATGRYKVVLSRADDRYVEHEDRLRVARVNKADLFISIHADATAGKTARGASVYTLADRAKNRSKGIVNSQNWIMDVNLSEQNSDVGNILVDLAQRNTSSKSTHFADILISNLGGTTTLIRNTHRRAGYYVLLAPDVPAVLLELGFISNPEDEKLLKSSAHRRKVMLSVTRAINQYFDGQKP